MSDLAVVRHRQSQIEISNFHFFVLSRNGSKVHHVKTKAKGIVETRGNGDNMISLPKLRLEFSTA